MMCFNHKVTWHLGQSCDQFQQSLEKAEVATETLIEQTSKRCPRDSCRVNITKEGGCDHMTCE
jgi:hypothetical protein